MSWYLSDSWYLPNHFDPLMRLFNLRSDPKEESDLKDSQPWAQGVFDKIVADFNKTTEKYPHVPVGAKDPYVPPVIK